MILEQIKGPEDLKKLTSEELSQLAEAVSYTHSDAADE